MEEMALGILLLSFMSSFFWISDAGIHCIDFRTTQLPKAIVVLNVRDRWQGVVRPK